MSHTREFSRYIGVSWDEPNGKWVARFKSEHLGLFDEECEAGKAVHDFNENIKGIFQFTSVQI